MIKKLALTAIAGSVFLMAPGQAEAQVQLGPTVAYHDDADFGVGAMARVWHSRPGRGRGLSR